MVEIISYFLTMVVKMIFLAAVCVGGIFLGKFFRNKKDAKKAAEEN